MDYVFDEKYSWIGWYRLKNGMLLHCDEYEGSSSWEKEWEDCDPLPDGAVIYDIYNGDYEEMDEYDGGLMGYMFGESFDNFKEFIKTDNPDYVIVEKVEEPDWY